MLNESAEKSILEETENEDSEMEALEAASSHEENQPVVAESDLPAVVDNEDSQLTRVKNRLAYEIIKKNAFSSALLNMFLPGAGYLYCGKPIMAGITFINVAILTAGFFLVNVLSGGIGILLTLPISICVAIALFFLGYHAAHKANKALAQKCMESAYQVDLNYWTVQRVA